MKYSFDWDDSKNLANFSKHGVWFEEARTIWADTRATEFFDPEHIHEEDRYMRIGLTSQAFAGRLLRARPRTSHSDY